MRTPLFLAACSGLLLASSPALAQSNVQPSHRYCWSENIGFMNFRGPGPTPGSQGVRVTGSYLVGYAWSENTGYIKFGNIPANGATYTNPRSGPVMGVPDYGVNRDPVTGNLSGFAWGENVGWINFAGGAGATPAQPARYDDTTKRLRGLAWGENIGWVNLDHIVDFIGVCPTDFDGDGILGVADVFAFLNAWFASDPSANFDGVGGLQVADVFAFLNAWFAGC